MGSVPAHSRAEELNTAYLSLVTQKHLSTFGRLSMPCSCVSFIPELSPTGFTETMLDFTPEWTPLFPISWHK